MPSAILYERSLTDPGKWQACAWAQGTAKQCERAILHYALMYSQDGPVKIKRSGYRKLKRNSDG